MASSIDARGYRANVGVILTNAAGKLFWGKRVGQEAWQFPQGGVSPGESLEETLYRELHEEIGLAAADVSIVNQSRGWLYYKLPERLIRYDSKPVCIGQKQWWFLLRLESDDSRVNLVCSQKPEFDAWRWVSYWFPLRNVVAFKREVYRRALKEFSNSFFKTSNEAEVLNSIFWDL